MNRNVESHFSLLPQIDIPRSVFDRSSSHKLSLDCGELVPIYIDEVLPGDSFRMTTSKVIRLQTLLTPIMDNIVCDFYHFFVPMRLCWSHTKEFFGENTKSAWAPQTEYTIPKISSPQGGFAVGTIADYMGIPPLVEFSSTGARAPSALPFRAYALICDTFFRDQNLTDPLNIPLGDANQQGSNGSNYIDDVVNGGRPFRVSKFHDMFSSSLPQPQKGSSVGFPISFEPFSGELPVYTGDAFDFNVVAPNNQMATWYKYDKRNSNLSEQNVEFWHNYDNVDVQAHTNPPSDNNGWTFTPKNLRVNIPASSGVNTNITINDLRLAFSLQRYLERLSSAGSRYIEILKGIFGVTSPDARLQLPEYLGGNRVPIQIHQVTNTAQAEQDFLGDLGAMSITQDVHSDFEKSFTEHGFIISLACIRYDHTYPQGLEAFWSRSTVHDFYSPPFASLGEMPIYKSEIFFDEATNDDVFGYNEAWCQYRFKPSRCSGEMRPGVPNSLASWHLADYYMEAPTLSDEWIREDKSNLDRCLAVTSAVSNQAWMDVYFKCICTRPMPMYSIPGLTPRL